MTRRLARWKSDRGAELIELALVMPILLLVIAGIIDFGFLFERYEVVTNAAREGARIAVLPGYTTADINQRITDYLNAAGLDGSTATVAAPVYSTDTLPSGKTVDVVKITVSYPSAFFSLGSFAGLVGGSGFGTITLNATSTMRVEVAGSGGL